jgi:hypothetical protein
MREPLQPYARDPEFGRYLEQRYGVPVPRRAPLAVPPPQGAMAAPAPMPQLPQPSPIPTPQPSPEPAPQRPAPSAAQPPPASSPQTEPGWLETIGGALSSRYDPQEYDRRVEQMRQQRLADPSSQESQAMRARMAPMLQQLGLHPSEIGQLSGADITRIGGAGGLTQGLLEARQKAAAAEQAARAQAALRAQQQQDALAKEQRAAAEWNRQNAVTAPQALERARAVGGMATGRMVQGALLQDELQSRRAQAAADRAEADRIAKENRDRANSGKDINTYNLTGWSVADPKRAQSVITETEQKKKLEDTASADADIQQGMAEMQAIIQRTGTSAFATEDVSRYTTARDLVMGGMATLINTGAMNEKDRENFGRSLPDIRPGLTWLDATSALGIGGGKPAALRGAAHALHNKADAKMRQWGFSRGGAPAARPSADPDEAALGITEEP